MYDFASFSLPNFPGVKECDVGPGESPGVGDLGVAGLGVAGLEVAGWGLTDLS
jgi:hypothetical protein